MKESDKIKAINEVVDAFFKANSDIDKILAKDLMLLFKKANIFGSEDVSGKSLRQLFRDLKDKKETHKIPSLHTEPILKNNRWYFIRIN